MNTLKKIYTALIIITVICLIVVGLNIFGTIKLTGETGMVILQIVYTILPLTFLFSKVANVIANRTNVILGYGMTFALLLYLLFFVIEITIKLEIPTIIKSIFLIILAYLFLLTLIYEVPQANTSHKKFQKILSIMATITFIIIIICILSLTGITTSANSVMGILKFLSVGLLFFGGLTLIGLIINPMMRVYHIDNDFASAEELDVAINKTKYYQANTQPSPQQILSDKYKKDVKKEDKIINFANKEQIVQELPSEVVNELPKGKVINEKYQQANISNIEIPLILNSNENNTPTEQPTENLNTQTTETVSNQEPVVDQNIIEMAKAVADEVVASQPLDNVVQPIPQLEATQQVQPTPSEPAPSEVQINNVPKQ